MGICMSSKLSLKSSLNRIAGIAQLVERYLAKVQVAGSNPVSRSNIAKLSSLNICNILTLAQWLRFRVFFNPEDILLYWLGGRVVMQRTATPCTPVRFRPQPPF